MFLYVMIPATISINVQNRIKYLFFNEKPIMPFRTLFIIKIASVISVQYCRLCRHYHNFFFTIIKTYMAYDIVH